MPPHRRQPAGLCPGMAWGSVRTGSHRPRRLYNVDRPAFLAMCGGCALVEVDRCWVLTLWSSSALAFDCGSWEDGKGSEHRYCLRDDGLMRHRSWLRKDN
jgi:hypothetical protein